MLNDEEIKQEWYDYQEWLSKLEPYALISPFERDKRLCQAS